MRSLQLKDNSGLLQLGSYFYSFSHHLLIGKANTVLFRIIATSLQYNKARCGKKHKHCDDKTDCKKDFFRGNSYPIELSFKVAEA